MKKALWLLPLMISLAITVQAQKFIDEEQEKDAPRLIEEPRSVIQHSEMYYRGMQDAKKHYKNEGAAWITYGVSLVGGFGPGLIPAITYSVTEPKESTFRIPSRDLYENYEYIQGYTDGAAKKRRKKVWLVYTLGGLTNTLLLTSVLLLTI